MNLGIAIATDRGLVVPVVPNARDFSVAGLARRIDDLVARAHAGKLRIEDMEVGTFTVNNTGAFGSIASNPIVNHPQIGIVTMAIPDSGYQVPLSPGGAYVVSRPSMRGSPPAPRH